jgi:hypothetical protein
MEDTNYQIHNNSMIVEGKSFKFKTKNETCFLKVTKIKENKKIFCNLVSVEKRKVDGSLIVNVHSGLDRRLYVFDSQIYSTSTNRVLEEITEDTFNTLYESTKCLKKINRGLSK